MSKILVIGDIHNNIKKAQLIIDKFGNNCKIILIGDHFDQFHDTPEDAKQTAVWLKNSLTQPNRIHLIGNHDFHYMLPVGSGTFCSGYTPDKHKAIQNILKPDDWAKLKYFHAENNCWFSHAGISYKWFSHPVHGVTLEHIETVIMKAKQDISARIYNSHDVGALWAADFYRGGRYSKGGLLWGDWRNIDFFKGITQVVGHTPREKVKRHSRKGGLNINVDTHLKECIILDTETKTFDVVSL